VPKRILIVDDEPHIVEAVRFLLEEEGYETLSAFNGEEALEKVEREHPDLVILDVRMPKISGWDVLASIKAHPRWRSIPVIILTVLDDMEDRIRGLEADLYLTKPIDEQELLGAVRRLMALMEE